MSLTDQQLRQELLGFGENVPPITQRNREQLRARLEVLRGQTRPRTKNSPSRVRLTGSPQRKGENFSPSRVRLGNSPSRPAALANGSPSRTRSNLNSSNSSRPSTRSKTSSNLTEPNDSEVPHGNSTNSTSKTSSRSKISSNLIELSDSEIDGSAAIELLATRSAGPTTRTRSTANRRQLDALNASVNNANSSVMTNDVEQSIARHRREIKQLLDSARDRTRATNSNLSLPTSVEQNSTIEQNQNATPEKNQQNQIQTEKNQQNSTKQNKNSFGKLTKIFQIIFIASIFIAAAALAFQNRERFFPPQKKIECSTEKIVLCEEMKPLIDVLHKKLKIRRGEIECGFRTEEEALISRSEIEKFLDEKQLLFKQGGEVRWQSIVNFILNKPISDISIWNVENKITKNVSEASKLSSATSIRSLTCEARQNIDATARNFSLFLIAFLILLITIWFFNRRPKETEENEETFNKFLESTIDLLEEQYEKHRTDPETEPWLIISQIRDKLIPDHDQQRLKSIWERVQQHINERESRVRSASQLISGEQFNVWQWIKSNNSSATKNSSNSPKKTNEETFVYSPTDVGLTECLKLRNFFGSENDPDDKKIDQVVDDVQNRCASVKRIEHIGIHSVFVYLKFSSKEAAANGYHLLNNWKYNGDEINAKYVRLNRYYDHFPEARDSTSAN